MIFFLPDTVTKYRIDGQNINGIWRFSNEKFMKQFYWYPGEPGGGWYIHWTQSWAQWKMGRYQS